MLDTKCVYPNPTETITIRSSFTVILQEFVPSHSEHQRVPWPEKWQSGPSIQLPSWAIQSLSNNLPLSFDDRIRMDELRQSIARQIQEKEEAANQLHTDIERLKKEAFACNVITSPFRSLPHDVLHHVATVCPSIHPVSAKYSNPKSHVPSIMAQISKLWRAAVEGNCSAWQQMRFDCRIWNGEDIELPLERIERFGRLSGTLLISLQLDEKDPDDNDDYQDGFPRILEWVLTEWEDRGRLRKFSLFTPSPYLLSEIVVGEDDNDNDNDNDDDGGEDVDGDEDEDDDGDEDGDGDDNEDDDEDDDEDGLPPINSFRLLTWEGDFETSWLTDGDDVTKFLGAWPSLRHLWVGGFFGDNTFTSPGTPHNPWNNIKTLYLRAELERDEWRSCFQNCPALENAWLHVGGLTSQMFRSNSAEPSEPSDTISHSRLRELHVGFSDFTGHILEYFVATRFTALDTLHLHFFFAELSATSKYRPKHFINIFPALNHLAIHETADGKLSEIQGLFPLLLSAPSTTSLWTSISHIHIMEFLEFFRGKRFPLPNLQSYTLRFVTEPNGEWLTEKEERKLTKALIATRQKRPAVLPPSSSTTTPGSSKKEAIHPGLRDMNILFRQFHQGDETEDDLGEFLVMDDYFYELNEKFVKENVDIKVEMDWVDDSESLVWHEDRAEREFMKRFDL